MEQNAVTIVLKAVDQASARIRQVSNELRAVGGVSGRVGGLLGNIPLLAAGGWAAVGVVLNTVAGIMSALGSVAGKVGDLMGSVLRHVIGLATDLGHKLLWVGGILTGVATGAMTLIGRQALILGGWFQQTSAAFSSMIGSAKLAANFLGQMRRMAFDMPFTFRGITDMARQLLAYGFGLRELPRLLTVISDTGAAFGGQPELLERIAMALGQIKAKGFAAGEEMRQLAQSGIPAWDILSKAFGMPIAEVMKKAESRQLGGPETVNALVAGLEARFKGMSKAIMNTLPGAWSNLVDIWEYAMTKLGLALAPVATRAVQTVTSTLLKLSESGVFERIGNRIANWFSPENIGKASRFFTTIYQYGVGAFKWLYTVGSTVVNWLMTSLPAIFFWASQLYYSFSLLAQGAISFTKGLFGIDLGSRSVAGVMTTLVNLVQRGAEWWNKYGETLGNVVSTVMEAGVRSFVWMAKAIDSVVTGVRYAVLELWALAKTLAMVATFQYGDAAAEVENMNRVRESMQAAGQDRAKLYDSILNVPYGQMFNVSRFQGTPLSPVPDKYRLQMPDFSKAAVPGWLSEMGRMLSGYSKGLGGTPQGTASQSGLGAMTAGSALDPLLGRIYGGGSLTERLFKRAEFGAGVNSLGERTVRVEVRITGGDDRDKQLVKQAVEKTVQVLTGKLGVGRSGVQPIRIGVSAS